MKAKIIDSLKQIDMQLHVESRVAKLVTLLKLVQARPDDFRICMLEKVDDLIDEILEGLLSDYPACVNELRESEENS